MSAKADGQVIIQIDVDDKQAGKRLDDFSRKVSDTGETAKEAAGQIEQTEESLEGVSKAAKSTEEQISKVGTAAGSAEKDMGNLRETTNDTEKAMVAASAACLGLATGLITIGSNAVQTSTEVDSAFAKTKTIMDENAMSASKMKDEIMALSSLSGMHGETVSEAVYNAISGSVATQDATAFVEKANKLAVSGFTSLANATDVLTTTLNAYGLGAEKVDGISNVLIQTQNLGKTSVDELAVSMGKAISTGSAYGVNLENLSTMYVELTKGGIATAEATTYISAMLNELGDAGSTVGGIIQEQTGKSFGQLMADGVSLGDVLKILSDTVNGDAEALMGLWSSQEAGKASNAVLTQGIEDFNLVLEQMEAEMSGTTGTTEKAYDTMTRTSEFIDTRFKNSVNNLGVAFGDNLRPAVDWVKGSLTSVVETVTGWVQKSPGVTATLTGVTLGIGALGIALAACTLKAKLATSEMWSLTAAMMSNPAVLIAAGITALVVGIGAYIAASSAATDETEKLTASSKRQKEELNELEREYRNVCEAQGETSVEAQLLKEKIDNQTESFERNKKTIQELDEEVNAARDSYAEMARQYDEAITGADKEYDSITNLVERLNELTSAEQDSAAAKEEILTIVDLLNEKLPELGLNYDAVKGKMNLSQEDVINVARAELDNEKRTATYTSIKTALEKDGEYEQVYLDAKSEWGAAKKAYEEAQLKFEVANAEELSMSEYERLADQVKTTSDALDEAKGRLDTARDTYYKNQTAINELSSSLAIYSDEANEAADDTETFATKFETAAEEWNSAAGVLMEAYGEAYGKARESIEGQIGLFEKMEKETSISVSGMIESLDSQIAYLNEYAVNMQLAAEKGINQGLLQKLSDGSKESAGILAELVTATEEEIAAINEKFAKVAEGKGDFAEAMTEYTGVVEDEKQIMVDLAGEVGLDMSEAITDGLLQGFQAYRLAWLQYQNVGGAKSLLPKSGDKMMSTYASGTPYAESGLALVGEAGPELVFLRGGERILTAEETREVFDSTAYPLSGTSAVGYGGTAASGTGAMYFHGRIEVPLYVNDREFARATANVMGEEMEWGLM